MRRISIAGTSFEFERADLWGYHCASEEADWNLELVRGETTIWLSGTMKPGPRGVDELAGVVMRLDPRALDEVVESLIGRAVTLYPRQDPGLGDGVEFRLVRTDGGVRVSVAMDADWDRYLESFPVPGDVRVEIEIEAGVGELYPGRLGGE